MSKHTRRAPDEMTDPQAQNAMMEPVRGMTWEQTHETFAALGDDHSRAWLWPWHLNDAMHALRKRAKALDRYDPATDRVRLDGLEVARG